MYIKQKDIMYLMHFIMQKCGYFTSRFHPKVGVRAVQKNLSEERSAIKFRHAVSIDIFINSLL